MKKCIISLLLALLMLTGLLPAASAAAGDPFRVVVSMEGLTLGQGLYFEPKAYTLDEINDLVKTEGYGPYTEETLTAGMATLAFLLDHDVDVSISGSWESDAYLSAVKGIDKGTIAIPSVIAENGGPSDDDNDGNDDGYLGEFDYSFMSGWMLTVNDFMIDTGCAAWRFTDPENEAKYLSDLGNTYVVRWQFTLWGYGADLGVDMSGWGGEPYFTAAKKAPLYAAYAQSADDEARAAARPVMEDLTAAQKDVDDALAALNSGIADDDEEPEEGPVSVTGVSLDCSEITLTEGETAKLAAAVLPEDADDPSVSWSSSDEDVASVDENGLVTAVSAGEAVITAKTNDGGFTADCVITVVPENLKEISAYDFVIRYISEEEGTVREIGTNSMMTNAGGVSVVTLPADAVIYEVQAADNYMQKLVRTKETASQTISAQNVTDTEQYFRDSEFTNHENMIPAVEKITLNDGAKIPALGVAGFLLDGREFWPVSHDDFVFVQIETEAVVPEDYHAVTVSVVPSTADVTFYSGENADDEWAYVTDNGVNGKVHEYVMYAPEGIYSYRAADGETDLGGMSFTVSEEAEQSVTLVRTNFYTTNKAVAAIGDYTIEVLPGSMAPVVNGEQYIDGSSRVVTPTMLWANGNAMLYNWTVTLYGELADLYGAPVSVNNTLAAALSAVQNKTFTLANLVSYRIVAPAGASVKMFNQIKNFNVEEIPETSQSAADGEMTEHLFRVAESSSLSYRVSMEGKITRAGYMGAAEKTAPVVVTFDENEDPKTTDNVLDSASVQAYAESSTMLNINCQNDLPLGVGETYRIRAYRGAWQIVSSVTANIMIEPDFHFDVISGGEHIRLIPAENRCTGNAKDNWMDVTGVSEGVAVIEVSYDAIRIGGSGTTMGGQYGATDPSRTSLVVIDVSGSSADPGELVMKAKGSENLWDTELDTVYTLEDTASLTFKATLDGAEPEIALSTDKGAGWTAVEKDGDFYTAEGLVPGNNILRFSAGGKTFYQVVRAAKISCTVANQSRTSDDVICEGDTVSVVFSGIYQPAAKFSGIYNPGFGGKPPHAITYDVPKGASVTAEGGQYDFISSNKLTITFGEAGTYRFTNGNVHFNIMGVDAPVGGHRTLTDAGVGANFSAVSTRHIRCVFPDLTFTVTAAEDCEHEWDEGIVTKAHTAAKAGEIRYTCTRCGAYDIVATAKGACAKFAEEVKALDPTCTEPGHTAGTRCSQCRKVLSGMEEIPAVGHSFSGEWTTDDTYHWHAAICEHTDETADKAAHTGGTATCTAKAVCEICGASYGEPAEHVFNQEIPEEKYLKSAASCTTPAVYCKSCVCGAVSETETFESGTATGHSFSEEWTADDTYHWHAAACGHTDETADKAEHDWDSGSVSGSTRTYTCQTCGRTRQETLRNYRTVLNETLAQLAKDVPAPSFGTGGGEWTVLALVRGGYYPTDSTYFEGYYERLTGTVQDMASSVNLNGALHKSKSTENARVIIALSAIGKDAANVGGVDLVEAFSRNGMSWIKKQGINGPIFALIALDTVGYETSDPAIRRQCIDYILDSQLSDGGWALSGNAADPDITSMAVQALANYRTDREVKKALDAAVVCLSEMQKDNGGFASWGSENSESIAQVIVALSALNIDADTDSRFVKNGHSALEALLRYYVEEKDGFAHVLTSGGGYTGGEVNAMATDQAAYALVAYDRMKAGKTRLYDMSDVETEPEIAEYDELLEELSGIRVRNADQQTRQKVQDARRKYDRYRNGGEYGKLSQKQKDELRDVMESIEDEFDDCIEEARKFWKEELEDCYDSFRESAMTSAARKELDALYNQALRDLDRAEYEEQMEDLVDQLKKNGKNIGTFITVTFRLIGCEQAEQDVDLTKSSYLPEYITWIPTTEYEIEPDSTVYDVFLLAIGEYDLAQRGADRNYVESVQAPAVLGGYWLGEFDNGRNSGWMYTLNGTHPALGLKEQKLEDGDEIVWHYVNDYACEVSDWFDDPDHPSLGDGTYYNLWLRAADVAPIHGGGSGNRGDRTKDEEASEKSDEKKKESAEAQEQAQEQKPETAAESAVRGADAFYDVHPSDWFYGDVDYAVKNGLFRGTSDVTFSPNAALSRAMLVTVLYRLEGEPAVDAGNSFADVVPGSWYEKAVAWAKENGIVNGVSATRFDPDGNITREQMAAILYRYAGFKGYDTSARGNLSGYADSGRISAYAFDAMAWANAEGLIQGSGILLTPTDNATRAQTAAILHRFCEKFAK